MTHLLWHYVVGSHLQLIIDSGALLPDTFANRGHLACVWFGRDDFWEQRSGILSSDRPTDLVYRLNRNEIAERSRGLGRIGVFPEILPYTWPDYERMLRDSAPRQEIVHRSRMISARYERFSSHEVPMENWQAAQVWQDGAWANVPFGTRTQPVVL